MCDPRRLIEKAKRLGAPAIAETNHGGVHSWLEFYEAAVDVGIKPILGLEAYQSRKTRFDRDEEERPLHDNPERGPYHLTLLARDQVGYHNLMKLSSRAYLEGFYGKPRLDFELLEQHGEGVTILSGCLAGGVCQALLRKDEKQALEIAARLQSIAGKEYFYIEVMDHGIDEQRQVMPALERIAKRLGAPLVPTGDCHYVEPGDAHSHDIMMCLNTKAALADENRFRFETDEFYLKSYEEMAERFPAEWLANTLVVAEQVDLHLEFGQVYFPEFPKVPPNETADSYLESLIRVGLRERYGDPLSQAVRDRANHEFGVVQRMEFSSYFLVVQDLVRWAKEQKIRVGWGRGSAAGSILSYALGITDLDPLQYGLLFERFLVEGRKSMPDIDLDFDDRHRDRVIEYARSVYGDDHVAHICTFNSVGARQAIRDAARVLGRPYADGDRLAKLVPPPIMGFSKSISECRELAEFQQAEEEPADREVLEAAVSLEGVLRQTGIHAAGVVISQKPLLDVLPVMRKPAKDGSPGPVVAQWDMHRVEQVGQLKIDFLGLRNLSVIDLCVAMLDQDLDIKAISLDDEPTYTMLQAGDTMGVFQLEGEGIREMTVRVQPASIEDIMTVLTLYRPGPLGSGLDRIYLARRAGKAHKGHPTLDRVLAGTHGVMMYQEDVLRVAQELAGFSVGEADDLRKAIGKKSMAQIAKLRDLFIVGCQKHSNVARAAAEKLYQEIEHFGNYAFGRAHAASYAMISYVTAFLKCHYPAAYMAALLSVSHTPEKQTRYLSECRRLGLVVGPPSMNRSQADFSVVGNNEILFGLRAVRGVGEAIVETLVRDRADEYQNIYDFMRHCDPDTLHKTTMTHLAQAGALDELVPDQIPQPLPRNRRLEILALEKVELGVHLTEHPFTGLDTYLADQVTHPLGVLAAQPGGTRVRVAGLVVDVRPVTTKRGGKMMRFSLEDSTTALEVVVFPREFKRLGHVPVDGQVVFVDATVMLDDDEDVVAKLFAEQISLPELPDDLGEPPIVLNFTQGLNYTILQKIEQLIHDSPGRAPVQILYHEGRHMFTFEFEQSVSESLRGPLQQLVTLAQGVPA